MRTRISILSVWSVETSGREVGAGNNLYTKNNSELRRITLNMENEELIFVQKDFDSKFLNYKIILQYIILVI